MSYRYPFCDDICLHVKGRIAREDACRQERTAREILHRLRDRPGMILADEVGMGKTFVALAVATSVALADRWKRPVVVMVPPSLKQKWPSDFQLFREKCLPPELREQLRFGQADRAEEFLKLLDDEGDSRTSIIFVTHGALARGLGDGWVMAAIIYQAMHRHKRLGRLRTAISRIMGDLLRMKCRGLDEDFWDELLRTRPSGWLDVMHRHGVDPEGDGDPSTDDDPVPQAVRRALPQLNQDGVLDELLDHLKTVPYRRSANYQDRLDDARQRIRRQLKRVWKRCIRTLRLRLPLLILDEAHHLKNPDTRLATLFHSEQAEEDANQLVRGPLEGVFERMLFLTATPFQLGHHELCSVLNRFGGISWNTASAPRGGPDVFEKSIKQLRDALDAAQHDAQTLDTVWGQLQPPDLRTRDKLYSDVAEWWNSTKRGRCNTPAGERVVRCHAQARESLKHAEVLIRPWVIRHLKPRNLPPPNQTRPRRERLPGRAICPGHHDSGDVGIAVNGSSLLPFLLASRATSNAPDSRPVFAEGLASSYEAFLQTRKLGNGNGPRASSVSDLDDDPIGDVGVTAAERWYLSQLAKLIPEDDGQASLSHPKMAATVRRAVEIWERGEKVLIFCHYVATGRALRQRISEEIRRRIVELGAKRMGCKQKEALRRLELIGKRFFDQDSPLRRALNSEVQDLLRQYPKLIPHFKALRDVVRRNIRTPSFLVRFFPLGRQRLGADAVREALEGQDLSKQNLKALLSEFLRFLVERCGSDERQEYIEVVSGIQTGTHSGKDVAQSFASDERQGSQVQQLLPNVRLANGTTRSETRRRLMLAFNTPFYPEILIASSVMAEGVDLQLNCRYVIHHDLCWNPSTLEQRTGRIDRVGAKAERCGQPICLYLPYVAETQDEKMYRVVMDRQRWFGVVMGERFQVDTRTTEKLAARLPLPEAVATELAFRLHVEASV